MKTLYEEFREYTEMWEPLKEFVDKNGNKIKLNKSNASTNNRAHGSSITNNECYLIFNYYRPNSLDSFCMLWADKDKADTVKALIDMAEQSVENFGIYKNTLVCYKIDPADYDMTIDEFIDAAESKHDYCGEGLHHRFTEVVYTLSALAANEKPLYKLDMPIVEIEFYDEFLKQKNNTGITLDDIYDSNYSTTMIKQVYNDAAFQKFMKDKLARTITNAL